jgi:hypothetical protein
LRTTCQFALLKRKDNTEARYNYLESRINIYCKEYMRLIRNIASYDKLLNLLKDGQNICIFEIDVPAKNKKGLYKTYSTDNNIFNATEDKINDLLNDTSNPFGHGLCLAMALLQDLC